MAGAGPYVLWVAASGTKIVRFEKPAWPPIDFASRQAVVEDMLTDGATVYWCTGAGKLLSLPIDKPGQEPKELAAGLANPYRLGLLGEDLYALLAGDGRIVRLPKVGGEVTTIATLPGARSFAVDQRAVFVTTDGGDIVKIPRR